MKTLKESMCIDAKLMVDELHEKTGKTYRYGQYTMGKLKCLDIWADEEYDHNLCMWFRAKTWGELEAQIHKSWDVYLTLSNM